MGLLDMFSSAEDGSGPDHAHGATGGNSTYVSEKSVLARYRARKEQLQALSSMTSDLAGLAVLSSLGCADPMLLQPASAVAPAAALEDLPPSGPAESAVPIRGGNSLRHNLLELRCQQSAVVPLQQPAVLQQSSAVPVQQPAVLQHARFLQHPSRAGSGSLALDGPPSPTPLSPTPLSPRGGLPLGSRKLLPRVPEDGAPAGAGPMGQCFATTGRLSAPPEQMGQAVLLHGLSEPYPAELLHLPALAPVRTSAQPPLPQHQQQPGGRGGKQPCRPGSLPAPAAQAAAAHETPPLMPGGVGGSSRGPQPPPAATPSVAHAQTTPMAQGAGAHGSPGSPLRKGSSSSGSAGSERGSLPGLGAGCGSLPRNVVRSRAVSNTEASWSVPGAAAAAQGAPPPVAPGTRVPQSSAQLRASSDPQPAPPVSAAPQAAAAGAPPQSAGALPPATAAAAAEPAAASAPRGPAQLLVMSPHTPVAMVREEWSLEDYEIVKRIYKGAMSAVYQARCLRSGMMVALKVYFLSRVQSNLAHMLVREMKLHSALAHKHVLLLYAAFQDPKYLVLVEEHAAHGDLHSIHRNLKRPMTEGHLTKLVLQPFLDALSYLHARGICHRDIKPENILFTHDWRLVVADFGVAINLRAERAVTRTGTLEYMAPEVERCPVKRRPEDNKDREDLAYGTPVDVYATGVLAYELLVGFAPFSASTKGAAHNSAAASADPPCVVRSAPLVLPPSLSPGARDFIVATLAEWPEDRPTAAQLATHPWVLAGAANSQRQLGSGSISRGGSPVSPKVSPLVGR